MAAKEDPSKADFLGLHEAALKGYCQCSAIVLSSSQLPLSITLCYCTQCQKMSGAPFIAWGLFDNRALQWWDQAYSMSKSPNKKQSIRIRASTIKIGGTPLAHRGSCRDCGSPLFMKYSCNPDHTSVALGIVDNDTIRGEVVKPKEHIFLKEKAMWWSVAEDGAEKWDHFDNDFLNAKDEWAQGGAKRREDVSKDDDEGD